MKLVLRQIREYVGLVDPRGATAAARPSTRVLVLTFVVCLGVTLVVRYVLGAGYWISVAGGMAAFGGALWLLQIRRSDLR